MPTLTPEAAKTELDDNPTSSSTMAPSQVVSSPTSFATPVSLLPTPASVPTDMLIPSETMTPTPTLMPTDTATITPTVSPTPLEELPVAQFGMMDVQPATLTFAADPGVPKRDLTSGTVVIHVATNAAHGFVLRLASAAMHSTGGLVAVLHVPRLHLAPPDGPAPMIVDASALGSDGIVLADSPDPVPDGQAFEFRLLLTADVDFTTSPDSYTANLRFSFEPRYY